MSYSYQKERPNLFTESGSVSFLKVRDKVQSLLKQSGAFTAIHVLGGVGSTWEALACLDRMIELGELELLSDSPCVASQFRVYTLPAKERRV
jgi:hypothetical protein